MPHLRTETFLLGGVVYPHVVKYRHTRWAISLLVMTLVGAVSAVLCFDGGDPVGGVAGTAAAALALLFSLLEWRLPPLPPKETP